jgi:hypothetical protein
VTAPQEPRRRLADRLIDAGTTVAQQYAGLDRWDPARPTLAVLVAETLAQHERIGEERILARIRDLVQQREQLRDERLRIARRHLDNGNFGAGSSQAAWASALDEQIGALRLILAEPVVVDEPAEEPAP